MKIFSSIILLSTILLFASCDPRDETYCVTYMVLGNNSGNNWLISYMDTCGFVRIETTKNWTKNVCLSKNEAASLMVTPVNKFTIDHRTAFRKKDRIIGKISHPKKTVSESSENIILIGLTAFDVK